MKDLDLPSPESFRAAMPGATLPRFREAPEHPAPPSAGRGKRVLIADDDPGVRGSLSEVLISEGYVVIPANDGEQALALAASTRLDLILLDLNMPVKNGWDTFEKLTTEHPFVPVIIITARPNQLFTAMGAGVGALLEKPMAIRTLLETVSRLLTEPTDQRLARLAGHGAGFHYAAASGAGLSVPPNTSGPNEKNPFRIS